MCLSELLVLQSGFSKSNSTFRLRQDFPFNNLHCSWLQKVRLHPHSRMPCQLLHDWLWGWIKDFSIFIRERTVVVSSSNFSECSLIRRCLPLQRLRTHFLTQFEAHSRLHWQHFCGSRQGKIDSDFSQSQLWSAHSMVPLWTDFWAVCLQWFRW